MTKDELDKLIKYADHETIMREKLDRFKGKETEFTSKRPTQIRTGGWGGEDAVKIKFKISSISEDNGKPLVTIDVLDVLRREGGKGIETPENYLKNEISGVTKEKVENRIIVELGNKLKEFIGSRFKYNNEKVKSTKDIEFKFNHLRV